MKMCMNIKTKTWTSLINDHENFTFMSAQYYSTNSIAEKKEAVINHNLNQTKNYLKKKWQ